MMAPPSLSGHSLSHEQVMPFLKKLEKGQMKEGQLMSCDNHLTHTAHYYHINLTFFCVYCTCISLFYRGIEGITGFRGDFPSLSRHSSTFRGM